MKLVFKRKFFVFAFLLFLFLFGANKYANALNLNNAFNEPLVNTAGKAGYIVDQPANGVDTVITQIIQAVLSFLGVIFLILTIYGGYLWMMARGNEQQVVKAKSLLTEAVIGLIIVVAAYAISYFVIKKIGESTLQSSSAGNTE